MEFLLPPGKLHLYSRTSQRFLVHRRSPEGLFPWNSGYVTHSLRLCRQHFGRVKVSIMAGAAIGTRPHPYREVQFL
jgi:hypothetical protein